MFQLVVIDTGTEEQDYYTASNGVWQETSPGSKRFLFPGTPCLEYERSNTGTLETDEYGQPKVATYTDSDGNDRPKHGPILMRWDPNAFTVTSGDGTYTGYRGAWVASGGDAMRPHSHVSASEGYVITNGIY